MTSIVQTQTTSFKKELYQGIHDLTTDVLKIALYTANADLNAETTAYTTTAEITGTGYSAGGKTLTGTTINSSGYTAFVDFDNVEWNPGVFTARCALIYNSSPCWTSGQTRLRRPHSPSSCRSTTPTVP
jgi:hypothetical protein